MIKLKNLLYEKKEIGGYYLMKQLNDLAKDAKRSGERKVAKALKYLYDRINQSFRDIDLNAGDLNDLLKDPRGRKHAKDLPDWMIDDLFESVINERKLSSRQKKAILIAIEMSGNMTGATKKIEKIKKGLSNDKKVKGALRLANESVNERIKRNEIHAETKKELKTAIARSMKEILNGKTPKYDIINSMTGEMIGWKKGNEYIWQPNAIPDAERELP